MEKLDGMQVKAVGEHYVLSRLLSLGFIAGLSPENTKDVDIIAVSQDGKRNILIQVKTRSESRSKDWSMSIKHESIVNDNLFYVFVSLPIEWNDHNQPQTYIIPSKKVATVLSESHKDWLSTPGKKGQKRNDGDMRRIKHYYEDSPSISKNWLDQYKDCWSIFRF